MSERTALISRLVDVASRVAKSFTAWSQIGNPLQPVEKELIAVCQALEQEPDKRDCDNIVLNLNRPALERLLGGDSDLEVKLRHAAANEFARRHLKALITAEFTNRLLSEIKSETAEARKGVMAAVTREVEDIIGKKPDFWSKFELSDTARETVRRYVQDSVEQLIKTALDNRIPKLQEYIERSLQHNLEKRADLLQREAIDHEVRSRIQTIIQELNKGAQA